MSTGDVIVRPLGRLEKLYTARQFLRIYNSVIITATYALPTYTSADALYSLFAATLPSLLERHPALCCYVSGVDSSKPEFRRLATIEVKDVIDVLNLRINERRDLTIELRDLHDQPWSTGPKPLWRIYVVQEPQRQGAHPKLDVAFVYHHVLGDGLSGLAVLRCLIHEIRRLVASRQILPKPPTTIATPMARNLIAPVETLIYFPLSWSFLLQKVWQEYAPTWLMKSAIPTQISSTPQSPDKYPSHTQVRIITIPGSEIQFLLSECKKHSVTLTSLLTSLIVSTLTISIPSAQSFVGITPYTLRDFTGTSKDEMVNQSSAFETRYSKAILERIRKSRSEQNRQDWVQSLWDTARFFHDQMQIEQKKCPKDNPLGLLSYVSDSIKFYERKFDRPREATFELSNLGTFDPGIMQDSAAATWNLDALTFTQGAQPVGAAITVNCVSINGGPLTIAITWQHNVVSFSLVDVIEHAIQDLPRLLSSEVM